MCASTMNVRITCAAGNTWTKRPVLSVHTGTDMIRKQEAVARFRSGHRMPESGTLSIKKRRAVREIRQAGKPAPHRLVLRYVVEQAFQLAQMVNADQRAFFQTGPEGPCGCSRPGHCAFIFNVGSLKRENLSQRKLSLSKDSSLSLRASASSSVTSKMARNRLPRTNSRNLSKL